MTRFSWQCLLLIVLSSSVVMAQSEPHNKIRGDEAIHRLIDGLHLDAAEARFDSYFERFTPDAVFLGTDRTERWSIAEFKAYAKPIFESGQGWRYDVVERNLVGTAAVQWFDELLYNQKYGYCRGTGVVQRDDNGWKVAHYSLAFLIPNEVASEMVELVLSVEPAPDSGG